MKIEAEEIKRRAKMLDLLQAGGRYVVSITLPHGVGGYWFAWANRDAPYPARTPTVASATGDTCDQVLISLAKQLGIKIPEDLLCAK